MHASLAKAELHLHIEGTLEPELAFALAARNSVELPYPNSESLAGAYNFNNLQSFLNLYYECTDVLQTTRDFHDLAEAYLMRAHADGVVHAEIFFDPQAHISRGIPLGDVMAGLTTAADAAHSRYGISIHFIACFLRDKSADEAMRTLQELGEFSSQIIGIGLDSAEVGFPPSKFQKVFEIAADMGFRRVAHAGEEGPPEYIWQALDLLGVERIDHGIRCVEDDQLIRRLVADQIPLTVCPLSNVRLKCVESLGDLMLPKMLEAGLLVSLNSDDPAYFGGYIGKVYDDVATTFSLSRSEMKALAANSFKSSFLTGLEISDKLVQIASTD